MATTLPFIVAEISCNWVGGQLLDESAGLLSQRFERVINVNASRGYRLRSFQLSRMTFQDDPRAMNETIVAVFERDLILGAVTRSSYPELLPGPLEGI